MRPIKEKLSRIVALSVVGNLWLFYFPWAGLALAIMSRWKCSTSCLCQWVCLSVCDGQSPPTHSLFSAWDFYTKIVTHKIITGLLVDMHFMKAFRCETCALNLVHQTQFHSCRPTVFNSSYICVIWNHNNRIFDQWSYNSAFIRSTDEYIVPAYIYVTDHQE